MTSVALLYLPVLHHGYIEFCTQLPKETTILILDTDVLAHLDTHFDYLRKEIRSLTPQEALISLRAIVPHFSSSLLDMRKLKQLSGAGALHDTTTYFFPQEDIFVWLKETYFPDHHITFIPTFLRWDRDSSQDRQVLKTTETTLPKVIRGFFDTADKEATKSSDWWRRVGCVIARDTTIIVATHNTHLPSPYAPYISGDPRNAFKKGVALELSTAIHAEADAIAYCAKHGISLTGTTLYVTTFPCPPCAKLIARSGISTLYFREGYSVLDGAKILEEHGVTIKKVSSFS